MTSAMTIRTRSTRRSRTPTRNDGSAPYAANCATALSSPTTATSNSCYANTSSSITTRVDRIAVLANNARNDAEVIEYRPGQPIRRHPTCNGLINQYHHAA